MTTDRTQFLAPSRRRVVHAGLVHRLHREGGTWCCMEPFDNHTNQRALPATTIVTCLWCQCGRYAPLM